MRKKLILHYLCAFIGACLFIFIINIGFMVFNIYILNDKEDIFNYYPAELMNKIYETTEIKNSNVYINDEGKKLLEENKAGLEILNDKNEVIFNYNTQKEEREKYSNEGLIKTYEKGKDILFIGEREEYSYLLFLRDKKIKRVGISYDANEITKIHRFPLLILVNILVVLIISFLYTLKLTKPINKVIEKIFKLSNGSYKSEKIQDTIYLKVEEGLNELGERLEKNEKEREKLDRLKEEWISNISHDIKTPLTSIIGNAEIMLDTDYELTCEERIKGCKTIINKSDYIKTLVEELNLWSKIKSESLILNKKEVNIVSLIRHIIIDIINDEKYKNIQINFNYSKEEMILNIDESLINRVFINILMNSIIHNDKNIIINVNIDNDNITNNKVNIIVSDNGKGIKAEEVDYIFKRYYRGTNTKNKIEGSGLGMAIAKDIIKIHNGEINVISELGKGMKIIIKL
ncbi:MAG: sensor histidine kinase [Clostridium sp.]